jgi:hypothetical protein
MSGNAHSSRIVGAFCTFSAERLAVSPKDPTHRSSELFGTFPIECTGLRGHK